MPPPNINGSYTRGRAWKPLPGIYLESEVLASAAFAELNLNGIRVLLRFYQKRHFSSKKGRNGRRSREILNNGQIVFPYTEAEEMGIHKSSYTRAIDTVLALGFIDIAHSGEGLYRSATLYAVSDRWRKWGTPDFVEARRPRRRRAPRGFVLQNGKS